MPSIPVVPEALTETTAGGPIIGGNQFPRASTSDETLEALRSQVILANGATRTYDKGVRSVFAVTWGRMTAENLGLLKETMRSPYVTYRHTDGETYVVDTGDGVSSTAIPGTFPILYTASITLHERDPR